MSRPGFGLVIATVAVVLSLVLAGDVVPDRVGAPVAPARSNLRHDAFGDVIDHLERRPGFHRALQRAFGRRYGGKWVDRRVSPPVYRIGVVRPTGADQTRLDAISDWPERFKIAEVRYPLRQMQRWQRDLSRELQGDRAPTSHWADPRTGSMYICARSEARAEAAARRVGIPDRAFRYAGGDCILRAN